MNSFHVLLTESVGVYVERSALQSTHPDYTALIAPDCTPWHGAAGYNKNSNTCANSHSSVSLRLLFTLYRISTIKLAVYNEDGSN